MQVDVVVVGGGVAGSACAARLAGEGLRVTLLEREIAFSDRIRGEGMGPWGFSQAAVLGLGEVVLATPRLNVCTRLVAYDETRSIVDAERLGLDATRLVDGSPGFICVGHPDLREQLITAAAAAAAGASILRGVHAVQVDASASQPTVSYQHANAEYRLTPRLVIGADGKDSATRRALGLELHATTARYLLTGMLVDDGDRWDRSTISAGVERGWKFFIQPRGCGLVRLYLAQPISDQNRLSGPDRARRFLETFDFRCIPDAEAFREATPAGPCIGHPMNDTWLEGPYMNNVVLVGDAAGWSDPIIGQGLSIAFRDARILTEQLLANEIWNYDVLDIYAAERAERMRRLRFANAVSTIFDQIGAPPADRARKLERINTLIAAEPALGRVRTILARGPENVPSEVFEPSALVALATA